MQHIRQSIFWAILLLLADATFAQLTRSTPEKQGVSSAAIRTFLQAANASNNEFHSFVLVKNGAIIAESWWKPYSPELKHTMYSVSKTFTATAIGIAVGEGRIRLTDKVSSFFPDDTPDTAGVLIRQMSIKDLITMSAGQSPDPTGAMLAQQDWTRYFLRLPITDTPGSRFLYNSAATYMLSAIIQKVTGEKLIDYLKLRLFEPLGIKDVDWEENPEGINSGGWGLRIRTGDMAKFGQLYLQEGVWNGQRILPATWVEEATSFKIANAPDTAVYAKATSDWAQGYCYQIWRCRNNGYRADGAFGQYIIVLPDQQSVLAITSETSDMQHILNLVWEYLLPALGNEDGSDKASRKQLAKELRKQQLPIQQSVESEMKRTISGKTFSLEKNENGLRNAKLDFSKGGGTFSFDYNGTLNQLNFVENKWTYGFTQMPGPSLTGTIPPMVGSPLFKVASNAYWKDANTFVFSLQYVESPHSEVYTFTFDNNNLKLNIHKSIPTRVRGGQSEDIHGRY